MMNGSATLSTNDSEALDRWTARKVRPIVILYVLAVFAAFMVVSITVFHSAEAVKALAFAAVGGVVAILPSVIEKVEYRMTDSGVEKRPVKKERAPDFKEVFLWDDLDRVVPMHHGFKYFKTLNETRPLRRFWQKHFSDRFSGEVHVEKEDLARVLEIIAQRGITSSLTNR